MQRSVQPSGARTQLRPFRAARSTTIHVLNEGGKIRRHPPTSNEGFASGRPSRYLNSRSATAARAFDRPRAVSRVRFAGEPARAMIASEDCFMGRTRFLPDIVFLCARATRRSGDNDASLCALELPVLRTPYS